MVGFLVKHKLIWFMGREYIDTPQTMVDITAKVIKKMYENESLEKKLESDSDFERELEKHSELHPNNCLTSLKSIRVYRTSASGNILHLFIFKKSPKRHCSRLECLLLNMPAQPQTPGDIELNIISRQVW